jgi:hypothetical protein
MTDSQSASLSWNKAPIWGFRPKLYYCQTVAGLLMWGALSVERTGLLFARVTKSLLQTDLLITTRHGPSRKHRSSVIVLASSAADTFLLNSCLETGCINPLFYCHVSVGCERYLATAAVYRVTS